MSCSTQAAEPEKATLRIVPETSKFTHQTLRTVPKAQSSKSMNVRSFSSGRSKTLCARQKKDLSTLDTSHLLFFWGVGGREGGGWCLGLSPGSVVRNHFKWAQETIRCWESQVSHMQSKYPVLSFRSPSLHFGPYEDNMLHVKGELRLFIC